MRLLRPELSDNPYAAEIEVVLPRILALADGDALSPTRGVADRQYWAWKLIDFPNATFQGFVNGLSILVEDDCLGPHLDRSRMLARIGDMCAAVGRITRRDGSLEEAFPHERSYCVTALVAYDLQKALESARVRAHLAERCDMEAILGPLVRFLIYADETHGLISNHLATAAAALFAWDARVGDRQAKARGEALMARIVAHQSPEGWFREYTGADPGYQTLCLTHLAECAELTDSAELWKAIERSLDFLRFFVHPDGSFGGLYGSRNTRIWYPAGMEALAERSPVARAIAAQMRQSISGLRTVPLAAIDQPNLSPVFNNYCAALRASRADTKQDGAKGPAELPAFAAMSFRQVFEEAGLVVARGTNYYTIVSARKGGLIYHWRDGRLARRDCGLVVEDDKGRRYTSQTDDTANEMHLEGDTLTIRGQLRLGAHPLPDAFRFMVLRAMSLSVFRLARLNALTKKLLARFVMGSRRATGGGFRRVIRLGEALESEDDWDNPRLQRVAVDGPFSTLHMASQGYWQLQDDAPRDDT